MEPHVKPFCLARHDKLGFVCGCAATPAETVFDYSTNAFKTFIVIGGVLEERLQALMDTAYKAGGQLERVEIILVGGGGGQAKAGEALLCHNADLLRQCRCVYLNSRTTAVLQTNGYIPEWWE